MVHCYVSLLSCIYKQKGIWCNMNILKNKNNTEIHIIKGRSKRTTIIVPKSSGETFYTINLIDNVVIKYKKK